MNTRQQYLMQSGELQAELNNPDLRIFDTAVIGGELDNGEIFFHTDRDTYQSQHIPGAAILDLVSGAADTRIDLRCALPSAAQLQEYFREIGINNDSKVVLYSSNHIMWSTRAWWLLHFAGHDNILVLEDGLEGWVTNGFETENGTNQYPTGNVSAPERSGAFSSYEEVCQAIKDDATGLLNVLSPEVFSGEEGMSYAGFGHIPSSYNLYYEDLLTGGKFKASDELVNMIQDAKPASTSNTITYCGGGIAATVSAFAHLLAGNKAISVYDGSMEDWNKRNP